MTWRTPVQRVCPCGTEFSAALGNVRRGRGIYCGRSCQSRATMRRRRAQCDFRGPNNPAWKGGISQNKRTYVDRYRERYPEHARANDVVTKAVASGRIVKPPICQRCERPSAEPLHGHHEDYSQPLAVVWVCRPCHRAVHALSALRAAAA